MSSRGEKCCVPGCDGRNSYGYGLLNFPAGNESLIKKWKQTLKIRKNTSETWKICGKHFAPSDIVEVNGSVEVKSGTIPSRNFEFELMCQFCFREIINERMLVELERGEEELFEKFTGVKLKRNVTLPNLSCTYCIDDMRKAITMKNKFIRNQKTCDNFMKIQRLLKTERLAKLGPVAGAQEYDKEIDDYDYSSDDAQTQPAAKRRKRESTGTAAGTSGSASKN